MEGISEEDRKLVMEMKEEAMKTVIGQGGEATDDEGVVLSMSSLTEEGVIAVKNAAAACERLLDQRVEVEMESKKLNDCFHVEMPKLCDQKVLLQEEQEDVFEMFAAKFIAEREAAIAEFRRRRDIIIQENNIHWMGCQLSGLGLDPTRARSKSRGRKRKTSVDRTEGMEAMDVDDDTPNKNKKLRLMSRSRSRSKSRPPSEVVPGEGFKDSAQKSKALKLFKKSAKKRNKNARRGEAS